MIFCNFVRYDIISIILWFPFMRNTLQKEVLATAKPLLKSYLFHSLQLRFFAHLLERRITQQNNWTFRAEYVQKFTNIICRTTHTCVCMWDEDDKTWLVHTVQCSVVYSLLSTFMYCILRICYIFSFRKRSFLIIQHFLNPFIKYYSEE